MKTRSEWKKAKKTVGLQTTKNTDIGPNLDKYHKAFKKDKDVTPFLTKLKTGYNNYLEAHKDNAKAKELLKSELLDVVLAESYNTNKSKIVDANIVDLALSSTVLLKAVQTGAAKEWSSENINYLTARKAGEDAQKIYDEYIAAGAPQEINVPGSLRKKSAGDMNWTKVDIAIKSLLENNVIFRLRSNDADFVRRVAKHIG